MKNKLVLLTLFFVACLQAQMVVKKTDGTVMTDGQIFTYSSTIYAQALLGFYVQNTSTSDNIRIKIKCESITNADGVNMQLCFGGVCLSSITAGNSYPSGQPVIIAPGASTINAFDDFYNQNLGDGINYPMDYVFKFYQMDSSNVIIGNSITVTYRYDPTLSTTGFELNSLNNMGIALKSTVISDVLEIEATKAATVEIYNLNGKLVLQKVLTASLNTIDVSGFQSNMYLMNFSTDSGQRATVKFIKK
jgi:hypothetical protein